MAFEPRAHLRKLPGRKAKKADGSWEQGAPVDYLEVKWRLVWLRDEHPDAIIETSLEHFTADLAVVKARVAIPGGGEASDYGSETPQDFRDYIEKASTKAIGRALATLGYGTQFTEDFESDKESADERDYEPNKANTVKETTKGGKRFHTAQAANAKTPADPDMELREWVRMLGEGTEPDVDSALSAYDAMVKAGFDAPKGVMARLLETYRGKGLLKGESVSKLLPGGIAEAILAACRDNDEAVLAGLRKLEA